MLIIIHGDDIVKTRKAIDDYTSFYEKIIRFELSHSNISDIFLSFDSKELFSEKKVIILEKISFLKKKLLPDLIKQIGKYCKSIDLDLIVWDEKEIDLKLFKNVENKKIILINHPKYYYEFLDSIKPGNSLVLKNLLSQLNSKIDEEQIFYSIIKRVRMLIIVKTGKCIEFEETKKMSTWQIEKLKRQAKSWEFENLIKLHSMLFDIELSMKTSNLPLSLSKHIDILLFSI